MPRNNPFRHVSRGALRLWCTVFGMFAGLVLAMVLALLARFDQWKR